MLPKQNSSWLLLAALFSLGIVTSNAVPTDSIVEDLQNRDTLDSLLSRSNPLEVRGENGIPDIPDNIDDDDTPQGDGNDIYRSKKEEENDPPENIPFDFPPDKKERAPDYSDDPKEGTEDKIVDSGKKLRARAKGTALRDITVQIKTFLGLKTKWLRTKQAWAVVDPKKRYSYYRAFKNELIYFKLAKGEKAEIDTKDLKMELDHNLEHQEVINYVFAQKAPAPKGVDPKVWRSWADQYTDEGPNTELKLSLARVINHPTNANNIDGVMNQIKGDLTTSVINKILTGNPSGGPKYHLTRARSALWATYRYLTVSRTQKMFEAFAEAFAKQFEEVAAKENKDAAKKCREHIKEKLVELRKALIKRAKDDLAAEKPDSWNPKTKTVSKEAFKDEDVKNKKQWDGTDGSKLEEKDDDDDDDDEDD